MFTSVWIEFANDVDDEKQLLKMLRGELRTGLNRVKGSLKRAVYVIRMTGDFVIAYEKRNSPVLYIGRGNCSQRLAAHLKNWLHEVRGFGSKVGLEIRVASPRRQKREDYFKNVEADLLLDFAKEHGALPFFNKRYEHSFQKKCVHRPEDKKKMRSAILIGSGNKPLWALKPTKANKAFATFLSGEHFE